MQVAHKSGLHPTHLCRFLGRLQIPVLQVQSARNPVREVFYRLFGCRNLRVVRFGHRSSKPFVKSGHEMENIQQIAKGQGVPVFWPMDEKNGWELDAGMLPGLVGPKTKAIIIVNPSICVLTVWNNVLAADTAPHHMPI